MTLMKKCSVCEFPRPAAEARCVLCGSEEFSEYDDSLPMPEWEAMCLRGEIGEAYRMLEERVAEDPDDGDACLALAWLSYACKDFRAVETWSHETMRVLPQSPEPHLLIGKVLLEDQRWEEAIEELNAGLRRTSMRPSRRARMEAMRADAAAHLPKWW